MALHEIIPVSPTPSSFSGSSYQEGPRPGEVWLVGAGPGDPGLLTMAGYAALQNCDVVVHDRLGCEELIATLAARIRRIDVGKMPGAPKDSQDRINSALLQEAQAGARVVRLKGGDPFIFGRGSEELLFLHEHRIPTRVIPGISSALAAPAIAGIPLTHRALARGFRVSTGRDEAGLTPTPSADDTRIYLMGVGAVEKIVEQLRAEGVPDDMPAAAIEQATTYRQRIVRATLATLADTVQREGVRAPAVLVIGPTAGDALAGIGQGTQAPILVTSSRIPPLLAEQFPESRVLHRPLVRVEHLAPSEISELRARVESSFSADWLVFSTPHAAEGYFHLLRSLGWDARRVQGRLAAVGRETGFTLEALHLCPDLVAVDGRMDGLLDLLGPQLGKTRVVAPCEAESHAPLARRLATLGVAEVALLPAYRMVDCAMAPLEWNALRQVFFATARAVELFQAAWPEAPLAALEALCIGEAATKRATEAGFSHAINMSKTAGGAESSAVTRELGG